MINCISPKCLPCNSRTNEHLESTPQHSSYPTKITKRMKLFLGCLSVFNLVREHRSVFFADVSLVFEKNKSAKEKQTKKRNNRYADAMERKKHRTMFLFTWREEDPGTM